MTTEVMHTETEEGITRYKATIEEFWALPESMQHIEYIDGEILMAPTPTVAHQAVLRNISFTLHEFVKRTALGSIYFSPLDVILPSGAVVQPDAFFLDNEESKRALAAKRVHGAPSFVVEILSPGSVKHDARTKRALYERNGIREYWIVDPKRKTIVQMVLRGEHYESTELAGSEVIRSSVLSGFETTVEALTSDS